MIVGSNTNECYFEMIQNVGRNRRNKLICASYLLNMYTVLHVCIYNVNFTNQFTPLKLFYAFTIFIFSVFSPLHLHPKSVTFNFQ